MTAAAHLARNRVAVNAVHSGLIDTAMLDPADQGGLSPTASHHEAATRWGDIVVELYARAVG